MHQRPDTRPLRRRRPTGPTGKRRQGGVVLLAIMALITLTGLYLFIKGLNASQLNRIRSENGAASMAQARQALIADALSPTVIGNAGFFPLPDRGVTLVGGAWTAAEGIASQNFSGNAKDRSVIGKFPWVSLSTGPLRDATGNCLWYVVSGRFKSIPKTDVLNWDTLGQLDVIDASGHTVATNLAALVIAPGTALSTQDHGLNNAAYRECAGNYDARQYLDPLVAAQAISGQVNYFSGGEVVAPDTGNKTFVLTENADYNDRLVFIHPDDIFNRLIRRRDFATDIGELLKYFEDQHKAINAENFLRNAINSNQPGSLALAPLPHMVIAGDKGTDNMVCPPEDASRVYDPKPSFCRNWKEMLFLTELPTPVSLMIDGVLTSKPCVRVLIFGGRKTAAQTRLTASDRANKNNYLESPNNTSFAVPIASASSFAGTSEFKIDNPSADLIRCLE